MSLTESTWRKRGLEDGPAPVALGQGVGWDADCSRDNSEVAVELAEASPLFIGNQSWSLGRLEFWSLTLTVNNGSALVLRYKGTYLLFFMNQLKQEEESEN